MNQPRGQPFQPGNSFGRGRPKGSRNRSTKLAQELLDNYSSALISKCIQKAIQGDSACMRLCIERIVPILREKPVHIKLPKVTDSRTATVASENVIEAAAQGKLTLAEGEAILRMLEKRMKMIELEECMDRIHALENKVGMSRSPFLIAGGSQ